MKNLKTEKIMNRNGEIQVTYKKLMLFGTLLVFIAIVFMSIGGFNYKTSGISGNLVNSNLGDYDDGEFQNVKLYFKNYEYHMEPSTLKEGVPVRMEVDLKSVTGCMRSIVIPEFGVKKYVTENDNVIEFVPNKNGNIDIACSMNMGRGEFMVVE